MSLCSQKVLPINLVLEYGIQGATAGWEGNIKRYKGSPRGVQNSLRPSSCYFETCRAS